MVDAEPTSIEHCGCRLAYRVRGDGPLVLWIQGVAVHGDGWRPQVDDLADAYRCLSFDNRGMGRSQPLGAPLSVAQMAEDARVLMDAQGWSSAPGARPECPRAGAQPGVGSARSPADARRRR